MNEQKKYTKQEIDLEMAYLGLTPIFDKPVDQCAPLQARVQELEDQLQATIADRKMWFDKYTHLAVKQQNTLIADKEKLMGLLEYFVKNHLWFCPEHPDWTPEQVWQSYCQEHGLTPPSQTS